MANLFPLLNVPKDTSQEMQQFLEGVKQWINIKGGFVSNSDKEKIVAFKDLEKLGVDISKISSSKGQVYNFTKSKVNYVPPQPPKSLAVENAIFANILTWTDPEDEGLDYIEVWSSKNSEYLSESVLTGLIPKGTETFSHSPISTKDYYYYWIRAVDTSGNSSTWNPKPEMGGMYSPPAITASVSEMVEMLRTDDISDNPFLDSTGFGMLQVGETDQFVVNADMFRVFQPGTVAPKEVFTIGNISGTPTIGISGDMIVDGTIVGRHIDAGVITADKMATELFITSEAQIADGVITSAKIGNAQITNAKIANGAITNAKIANATISSAKIDSLDGGKIDANSISADKLNVSSLSSISANIGTITAGTINANNVSVTNLDASQLTRGSITYSILPNIYSDKIFINNLSDLSNNVNGTLYFRTTSGSSRLKIDANYVESINSYHLVLVSSSGTIVAFDDIEPASNNSRDLGSTSRAWNGIYFNNAYAQCSCLKDIDCLSILEGFEPLVDETKKVKLSKEGLPKINKRSIPDWMTNKELLYNEMKKENGDLITREDYDTFWDEGEFEEGRAFRNMDHTVDVAIGAILQLNDKVKALEKKVK